MAKNDPKERKRVVEPSVRLKSSQRKHRSDAVRREQRAPVQDRSRARHDAILDATSKLLETANIEDLSLSDVGEAAKISKASVHYHFPTIAAIQLALGRRFDQQVTDIVIAYRTKLQNISAITWQEWFHVDAGVARDFFNDNRPACECLLGPLLHRDIRLAGYQDNIRGGAGKFRTLREVFDIPNTPEIERAIGFNGEILDLFWSSAYLRQGHIDDETFEESVRASLSYMSNFIPANPRRKASSKNAPPGAVRSKG